MSETSTIRSSGVRSVTPLPSVDARAYAEVIERLARQKVNQRISNSVPIHAAILLETMFRHAKDEVRIYTGELAPATYGHPALVREAKRFISRPGTCLKILLQRRQSEEWIEQHLFTRHLLDTPSGFGVFEVRNAEGVYATDKAKHFSVMDATGFRFELSHDDTKAVANFNEPHVAQELSAAFDKAFEMATTLVSRS